MYIILKKVMERSIPPHPSQRFTATEIVYCVIYFYKMFLNIYIIIKDIICALGIKTYYDNIIHLQSMISKVNNFISNIMICV